ncbi:melanoma-associated antigen B16 [Diachasma alloeum]|uniref:melanoma-associated antigen B16 n=1 Tax=Diachasma alloeum TaxID=454923 RepID=UPI0007382A98|nr:melanoma-associated antigen B16 [Diachasma alloeum]
MNTNRMNSSQRYKKNIEKDIEKILKYESRRRGRDLPESEESEVVGTLLDYLLEAAKNKRTIKHTDIKCYVIPDHNKYYTNLMAKTKAVLHQVFGYKLIGVGGQKWVIVNILRREEITLEGEDIPAQTLLLLVLSHIFTSGEPCREVSLINFLAKFNIWRDHGILHPYFGNVEELVRKTFVQQVYLVRCKAAEIDKETYEYTWGPRAKAEFDPKTLVEFVKEVISNLPATNWTPQCQKAFSLDTPAA